MIAVAAGCLLCTMTWLLPMQPVGAAETCLSLNRSLPESFAPAPRLVVDDALNRALVMTSPDGFPNGMALQVMDTSTGLTIPVSVPTNPARPLYGLPALDRAHHRVLVPVSQMVVKITKEGWIVAQPTTGLFAVDLQTAIATAIPTASTVWAVGLDATTGLLFYRTSGAVTIVDPVSGPIVAIPLGNVGGGMAVDAVARRVYLGGSDLQQRPLLWALDITSRQMVGSLALPDLPSDVVVDTATNTVYVLPQPSGGTNTLPLLNAKVHIIDGAQLVRLNDISWRDASGNVLPVDELGFDPSSGRLLAVAHIQPVAPPGQPQPPPSTDVLAFDHNLKVASVAATLPGFFSLTLDSSATDIYLSSINEVNTYRWSTCLSQAEPPPPTTSVVTTVPSRSSASPSTADTPTMGPLVDASTAPASPIIATPHFAG